jgi:copper transport protein
VLLFGLIAGSLLLARPATAHAVLIGSDPANGSSLAAAPRVAVLRFSEEISPEFSSARLIDGTGQPVQAVRAATDARVLTLRLPQLDSGSYGVVWRVLAEDDGHATSGIVVFSVGGAAGGMVGDAARPEAFAGVDPGTSARPGAVAARWLRLCLLAGLLGGLAVAGLVLGGVSTARISPPHPSTTDLSAAVDAARARLLTFAAACATLGAVDAAGGLARKLGVDGPVLFAARWGQLALARTAVLCALAGCVFLLRRLVFASGSRVRARVLWGCTAALILTTVTIEALGSHAAALGSARTVAVVSDAVHILTACLWLGAVAALVVVVWPSGPDAAHARLDVLKACRRPFTRLALLSFGLVIATGLYNAGRQVGSADALITTPYGRALLVKILILLVVVGLGLRNAAARTRGVPGSGTRPRPERGMRRIVAELGAGVLLLLVVGVLAETAPGRETPQPAAAPVGQAGQAQQIYRGAVADLVVSVSVTPNRPGANGFTVLAASTRRPPPAQIESLVLEFPTGTVPLRQIEPGRYFGTADLGLAGSARLTAVIHRAGRRFTMPTTWTVAPPAQGVPAQTSPTPDTGSRFTAVLTTAALIVLGAVLVISAWWLVVPRRLRRRTAGAAQTAADATGGGSVALADVDRERV